MKQNKFHVFIYGIIILIFSMIIGTGIYGATQSGQNSISFGMNGIIEQRCIDGYRYVVSPDGNIRQTMDEFGHGVKCK